MKKLGHSNSLNIAIVSANGECYFRLGTRNTNGNGVSLAVRLYFTWAQPVQKEEINNLAR